MSGSTGHVMNLANSIIGVGLLAMPFCFKQCGITLAIAMLMLSSIISRLACQFLIKSSALCRRRNFEFLAFYAFGPSGKLLVELGIIGFMMGTCVAFFVVMGDLGPAIVSKIFNITNNSTLRTCVLIALGVFVILPLGLLRNIESLVAISTVTIGFYFLFILKIFLESSNHLFSGDWWSNVNFWNPEGVLQCIPIFAMSLSCQMQLFEIYESLSSPTTDKINSVVQSAINLCTVVYASVGFLGYIAYCKVSFTGNILLSFAPSFSSEMFKLGFVMSIAVSFPLVIFPCRASLYSLIFKRMPIHHETSQMSSHIPDSRFKWLTTSIVMVSLVTGLLIPSIELVLGFVGSTIGIAICVVFPSLSYLSLTNKNASDITVAKVTVGIGFLIMIMGTFGNLLAAVETTMEDSHAPSPILFNPNSYDSKVLSKLEANVQQPSIKGGRAGFLKHVEKVGEGEGAEKETNQRREPPVPVAPGFILNTNKKPAVPEGQPSIQTKQKREPKSKRLARISEGKGNESINKDAIAKEEREIMEVENEKKIDGNDKERELLKVLKEQQEEQKKLLEKQEKILQEMKNRELKNEEKLNRILREQSIIKTSSTKHDPTAENLRGPGTSQKNTPYQKSNPSNKTDPASKQNKVHPQIQLSHDATNSSLSHDRIPSNSKPSPLPPSPSSPHLSKQIDHKKMHSINDTTLTRDDRSPNHPQIRQKRTPPELPLQSHQHSPPSNTHKCPKEDQNPPTQTHPTSIDTASSHPATGVPLIRNSNHVSLNVLAGESKYKAPEVQDPELANPLLIEPAMLAKKRDLKFLAPLQQ